MKRKEYSNKENAPKRLNELAAVQQDVAGTNQTIPTPPNVPANNTINEKKHARKKYRPVNGTNKATTVNAGYSKY